MAATRIRRPLRAVGRFIVTIAVVVYTVLDTVLFPLVRPLLRWLGSLRLFVAIGAAIGRLPPYAALLLLAVPFVLIEPLKVFALYWTATGHPVEGLVLLGAAHLASILICERVFHAAYDPLMRIGWFSRLLNWLFGLRDLALSWARSTIVWQRAFRLGRRIRAWFRSILAGLR